MAFTFETSGNNTFLVYAVGQGDVLDTMTLGMITNNRIPGLIPVLYTQMNRDCFLKYNVTARVTVKQFFSGVVNRRRLLGVFSGVTAALAAAEEYMIDYHSLLLDVEHVYADVSSCRADVVCLPLVSEAGPADIGMFFKNIMFSTQFDQTENCDYVARIINYLNAAPVFAVEDFRRLLEELQGGTGAVAQSSPSAASNPVPRQRTLPVQVKVPETPPRAAAPPQPVTNVSADKGLAVPGQDREGGFVTPAPARGNSAEKPVSQPVQEKEISMFYLLQHYNKENAAAYKAQKEARKKGGKVLSTAQESGSGFAVPGQDTGSWAEEPRHSPMPSAGPQTPQNPQYQAPQSMQSQPQQPPAQPQMQIHSAQPKMPLSGAQSPAQQYQAVPQASRSLAFSVEDNFGDTVVMGADVFGEDTVVMGESMAASAIRPYLLRSGNNERILIDKPFFRIGKERNYVDYCVGGNATVSRSHADIISRGGQYFIVDNNSTNHTFVNGEMIPSNAEIPLAHGTKIRLSNEEFEFFTYGWESER